MEEKAECLSSSLSGPNEVCHRDRVLVDVVMDGEKFDFCMCNPPFFESMAEAGLNSKTACGETPADMVFPGGEKDFITHIIEDSITLKQAFRWYTSMVGRKANLKFLTSKLWEVGVTIVKTTEFVQGKTSRWGLAWSFVPPSVKRIAPPATEKRNISFMLQGIHRQFSAMHVLQEVESFFSSNSASCKLNASSFTVDITTLMDNVDAILKSEVKCLDGVTNYTHVQETSDNSCLHTASDLCFCISITTLMDNVDAILKSEVKCLDGVTNYTHVQETSDNSCLHTASDLCFCISTFQHILGTLLVKGSLRGPVSGVFSSVIQRLEEVLKHKFCSLGCHGNIETLAANLLLREGTRTDNRFNDKPSSIKVCYVHRQAWSNILSILQHKEKD